MSEKNIFQRINAVMKEVSYVRKDAEVQGYKAVTHDMLTAVVRPSLVKSGIVVRVEQLTSSLIQQRGTDPKEKGQYTMHLYSGDYAVHFVNIDNPDDVLTVTVNAHANDTGDKAPGKAMSYAVKYAMLKTFSLETGENDEARFADPYTPEQFETYHEYLETGKAYEFYMFISTLPPETQAALYNSFPEGKKTQGKRLVDKTSEMGRGEFLGVVEDVQKRLANHDPSVTELTDEMTPVEKKYLAKHLSAHEVKQLQGIKNAEKAA